MGSANLSLRASRHRSGLYDIFLYPGEVSFILQFSSIVSHQPKQQPKIILRLHAAVSSSFLSLSDKGCSNYLNLLIILIKKQEQQIFRNNSCRQWAFVFNFLEIVLVTLIQTRNRIGYFALLSRSFG